MTMTLLYTGGLPSEPPAPGCLQPVITSFEATVTGLADSNHAYVSVAWTADNATSYTLTIDGQAAEFADNQALFSLAFGQLYDFALTAICGDLHDEAVLNYSYDVPPCEPLVTSFYPTIFGSIDANHIDIYLNWTADNAESYTLTIDGQAASISGNQAEFNLALGQTYQFILTAICGANQDTANLSYMAEFTANAGDSFTGGVYTSTYGASIPDLNNAKGVTLTWPIAITPRATAANFVVLDSFNQVIDATKVVPADLIEPNFTGFSGFDKREILLGDIGGAFAIQVPDYNLPATGQLNLFSSDEVRGDGFFWLIEGQGVPFSTTANSYFWVDNLGIYRQPTGNGYSIGLLPLAALAQQPTPLYISFQICNPFDGAAYTKPFGVGIGIFAADGTYINGFMLTGGKYHLLANGSISVVGGYITQTVFNNYIANNPNASYLTVISADFGD